MPDKLSDRSTNLNLESDPISYFTRNKFGFKAKNTKFLSLPFWDALTLLPYCKASSRFVDRHLSIVESDRHE